jgi:hypothetical protein
LPAILSDLARGGDVEWLAQYLARRRTMDMGLDDRPELDRRAAEAIVAWNSRGRPDCCYRLLATRLPDPGQSFVSVIVADVEAVDVRRMRLVLGLAAG